VESFDVDALRGALKAFVIIAGVAIVVGTGTLIWVIVHRATSAPEEPQAAVEIRPTFSATELQVPAGARIIDMRLNESRLVVHLTTPDEQEYIAVVDLATGRRLGLMRLVQQPQ
jgi:hypothetical protein